MQPRETIAAIRSTLRVVFLLLFLALTAISVLCFYISFEGGAFTNNHLFCGLFGVICTTMAIRLMLPQKSGLKKLKALPLLIGAAVLAFLVLVLVIWGMATGGSHVPWRLPDGTLPHRGWISPKESAQLAGVPPRWLAHAFASNNPAE